MKTTTFFTLSALSFGLAFAIVFNIWLDSGCAVSGIITTSGKVCVEQIQ